MRDRWGITPDTVTYTAAISACERGANCSVALGLLDLMKARVVLCCGGGGKRLETEWMAIVGRVYCLDADVRAS